MGVEEERLPGLTLLLPETEVLWFAEVFEVPLQALDLSCRHLADQLTGMIGEALTRLCFVEELHKASVHVLSSQVDVCNACVLLVGLVFR